MITSITTTVHPLNGNLVIAWTEADDQGEVITQSQVQVWSKTDSKWIDQSPLTVETELEIPMLELQLAPYGYSQGDPIQVQVRSANMYGFGPYSNPLVAPL
jgi:hypothetical protein